MIENRKKEIDILGIGLSTPVTIELALTCGWGIGGLWHYTNGRTNEVVHGYKIKGTFTELFESDIRGKSFILSMGDVNIRKELTEKIESLGGILPSFIHPTAIISQFADVSPDGVQIGALCQVQADSVIEKGVCMRDGAFVCHNTYVHQYAFICPLAMVGADLDIGERVFIGQASVLISHKATPIGTGSLVGAGAVVTKSISKGEIVAGNPAKVIGNG